MAELGHAIGFDETRRGVVNTSFIDFLDCKIAAADLEDSTEYIVIVSALIMGSDPARNDFYFRLEANGSLIGDSDARLEPRNSSSLMGEQYFWMDRYTTPATAVDIQFQGHSDATATNQRCVSFYAVAIKVSDLDAADFEDDENLTNLSSLDSSGWTVGTDITIGDGVSDWLVFGYARCLVDDTGTALLMRITDDAVQVGETLRLSGEDTVEVRHMGFMWALEGIASSDINLEFQTSDAVAGKMDVDRCMIFALRLNQFEDYLIDHDATDTEITSIDTDFGTISVSHTTNTAATRNWMVFGSAIVGTGDDIKQIRHHIKDSSTILFGDATDITDGAMNSHAGSADQLPQVRFGANDSIADSTSITAEIKNQENNDVAPTPDILDAHLGWFTWEFASAGSIITPIQGSNLGADLFNGTLT